MENQAPEVPPKPESAVPGTTPEQPNRPGQSATNGLAIAGMVTGIVALIGGWIPFLGFIIAVVAIILSILGLRKSTQKGVAIAGLVTGGLGLIWSLIVSTLIVIGIVTGIAYVNEAALNGQKQETQNSQNSDQTNKDDASVEDQEVLMGWQIKINKVTKDVGVEGEADNPERFIVVNMTVKNVSDDYEKFSDLWYRLNDLQYKSKIDGKLYSGRMVDAFKIEPAITDDMSIRQGETVTGNILFAQPPEGTALNLIYYYAEMEGDKAVSKEKKFDLNDYVE